MPKSRTFPLTAAYIEAIHDFGIALTWPAVEPVSRFDCLDLNLLESAAAQPFSGAWDKEFYPTIYDKAACLFFSIAGGHVFGNGNKRTAVLALDQFLLANAIYLLLSNEEIRHLAEETAQYRVKKEHHKVVIARISDLVQRNSVEFRFVRGTNQAAYRRWHRIKNMIRKSPLNRPGARPNQAVVHGR